MSAATGNRAAAQDTAASMPDAADGLVQTAPVPAPPLRFTDASGRNQQLATYAGHVLVVNVWATWCGPCGAELPSLDALAKRIEAFGGLVLPISIDIDGASAVPIFYGLHGIKNLPVLLNPAGDDLEILNTNGVPLTLILNPQGQLVAGLSGGANWDTPRMLSYLRAVSAHKSAPGMTT